MRQDHSFTQRAELALLLDFYGALLSPRLRLALELGIEEDLTLSEIGEETGISRQAVHERQNRALQQLYTYEEQLGAVARWKKQKQQLQCLQTYVKQRNWKDAEGLLELLLKDLDR